MSSLSAPAGGHAAPGAPDAPAPKQKGGLLGLSLTQWIIVSMVVGVLLGWLAPSVAVQLQPLSNIFLRMIKSLIVPLLFSTLVIGIAGHGDDMKKVGRLALRSIIYFEVVTTLALAVGLLAVNIVKPGVGVSLPPEAGEAAEFATRVPTVSSVLEHTVPQSFFEAAAQNEVLQIVVFAILFAVASSAAAALRPGAPIEVRILYDNSGSMYAGYQPPGSPERLTRAELGAHFFHELPTFAVWLEDFVKSQTIVEAGTVGMWTFTSDHRFTPGDIEEVNPAAAIDRFDVAAALAGFPARRGNSTFLTETLQTFTRDFTGLVWLVTDNIVETGDGTPDAGVAHFFETLESEPSIRSVHLFKYPIEEDGRDGALAVYALLVSPEEVPPETLRHYDDKLRLLAGARQRNGTALFPGGEHLKLKDLRIGPLLPNLRLVLDPGESGTLKEGQTVRLRVEGEIVSLLTQHSVTGGRYELAIASPFVAEEWAQRDLGAKTLVADVFNAAGGPIGDPIPPRGTRPLRTELQSTQPVEFTPSGVTEWVKLAWTGATVQYTATARMSFSDVQVRLEPQQMAGIFGIDHATTIFDFQDVATLPQVPPTSVPVSFALRAGSSRTAMLLVILAILGVLLGATAFLLSRRQIFRIALSGTPEKIASLRRLGRHDVTFEGKLLGRLSRGLLAGHVFDPVRGDATLTVVPASDPGTWDVRLTGGVTRRLSIKAEGGSTSKAPKAKATSARAGPPPPPPLPTSRSVPPRPTRIGRT